MESESKNIIQMLKNVKSIIEVSKGRDCWSSDELKNINITYHNVCEIVSQLGEKDHGFEEIKDDGKKIDESVEQSDQQEMDDVD